MGDDGKVGINKDLMAIKSQIRNPVKRRNHKSEKDQIMAQLEDLRDDVAQIKGEMVEDKDSPKKLKRKKEIIYLVKDEGEVTTSQLSKKIGLSRNRCSEYLNELKKEGIVTGEKRGRTKYYSIDLE